MEIYLIQSKKTKKPKNLLIQEKRTFIKTVKIYLLHLLYHKIKSIIYFNTLAHVLTIRRKEIKKSLQVIVHRTTLFEQSLYISASKIKEN